MNSWTVLLLVSQLGSPNFRDRETATKALTSAAPLYTQSLKNLEASNDMEVSRRSRLILNTYYCRTARFKSLSTLPSNYRRLPWISEQGELKEGICNLCLKDSRREKGMYGPPNWDDYQYATLLLVEHLYRDGWEHEDIVKVLDKMAETEVQWINNFRDRFDPMPIAALKELPR